MGNYTAICLYCGHTETSDDPNDLSDLMFEHTEEKHPNKPSATSWEDSIPLIPNPDPLPPGPDR